MGGALNIDNQRFLEEFALPSIAMSAEGDAVFANPAWRAVYGEVASGPWKWLSIVVDDDRERARREVMHAIECKTPVDVEFQIQPNSGARTICLSFGPLPSTECSEILGVARDVSEVRRREERLLFMAGHDPLTGLANRRSFEEELERAASLADRGVPAVLIMIDMDNLKRYNDVFGHLQGDQALVNLSMILRTHIRASDLAARIGGDEFSLLLSGASLSDVDEIAHRICEAAESEFVAGARETELGVSGGIVSIDPSVSPRVAMDRADAAMYAAKQSGRHRFVTWGVELGELAIEGRVAERVLEALGDRHSGVSLVFQPVVSFEDGSVSYYEALARLNGHGSDVIMPSEFLSVVERLGLMPRLTLKVLDLVIEALKQNPGVAVSVNLAAADIMDSALLGDIESRIRDADIDPASLLFEIPENALLSNITTGREWITRLSDMGCHFVLDEFGTGLGVFIFLRDTKVEQVKLSQSVIETLQHSGKSMDFVRSVRELVESQGKSTVAAFLDTDAMRAHAVEAGFVLSQGFAVCEPASDLSELIVRMKGAP